MTETAVYERMKNELKNAVRRAFDRLLHEDGTLFDCPIEEDSPYGDPRKLHEVCVNHRLANHLQDEVLPLLNKLYEEKMFVDIEFNRDGGSYKRAEIDGKEKTVRPDIIIHNRKSGTEKKNFLVVECKKKGASRAEINNDKQKILALMQQEKYEYLFGLQVIYGRKGVQGFFFFKDEATIRWEEINVSEF